MRQMKDSGISWIGGVPENWSVLRNKNGFLCSKTLVGEDSQYTQLLSLTTKGIKEKDIKNPEGKLPESFDTYQLVEKDNIVMCLFDLDCSAVFSGISPYDGMISPAYKVLRCRDNMLPKYADYWFRYIGDGRKFNHYAKNLRYTLNYEEFSSLPLLIPPVDVQNRIADYLDSKCSQIDSIISKQEAIIEKLKEYKLSVITEVVTKGLDPNVEMKDSGIEWLGMIPCSWKVYKIANLYDQTNERGNDELPILTVSINSGISDRELSDDEQERVFARSEDRSKYKKVVPGDLAYNMMRAWQGAFGAVRVEGMVSPAYVTCRPKRKEKIDTRYIEYLLRCPLAVEEMHRHSHGVADFRLRLYWPEFRSISLCLPSSEEQTEIANYIDSVSIKIDKEIEQIKKYKESLINYKKSLIFDVVTGKKEV